MTRVAIVSDTHVPSRASEIPDWVAEELRGADHTIHAGDFDAAETLATVRELTGDALTAVAGNVDPADLGLPEVATATLGGVEFVVTHGTGPAHNYEKRVAGVVRTNGDGAVGVSGHTHEVLDTVHDGVRLLNPGSATGAAPATETTMLRATAEDGELDVELLRE